MEVYNEGPEKELESLRVGQIISLNDEAGNKEDWAVLEIKENDTNNPDVILTSGKKLGSKETSMHEVKTKTIGMMELFELLSKERNFE